jgi:hypothetical protein
MQERYSYKTLLTTGRAVEYGRDRWEALLPRRPRRVEVSPSSSSSPRSTSPRCIKKYQVKIKIFFTFLKNISHYSKIKFQKHLLPSAWDVCADRRWDHRKVVRVSCQTQRLLEPRPQEQHHRSSLRQPRWTAAKPQPRDRW